MSARELVSGVWGDLVHRHHCPDDESRQVLDDLVRAYDEPHRHYHTLSHIADLLRLLDAHGPASDEDAVRLAMLFHDAVYDPSRGDNEAASAKLAVERLGALGFPRPLVAKVEQYILATQHGADVREIVDPDLQLLLDLDLSVLAAPPKIYRRYAQAIRKEYAAVPDNAYRFGRKRVLETFLARPRIYLADRLRGLWEAPARSNLASEIAELG